MPAPPTWVSVTTSRLSRLPRAQVGGTPFPVATDRRSRLLGLAWLERGEALPGLLIPDCSCVHTFWMRFALDLHFLDAGGGAPGRAPRRAAAAAGLAPSVRRWCWSARRPRPDPGLMMLPDRDDVARARHLRGRSADPGAALRPAARRPLRRAAGADRLRCAAPLPLQPAGPAPLGPEPAGRLRPRCPARDPRGRRGREALRPLPAGDRPQRPRRRDGADPRPRLGRRRLPASSRSSPGNCGRGSTRCCAAREPAAKDRPGSGSW